MLILIPLILIVLFGLLVHDAATIALDHTDLTVMFDERHDDD